MKHLLFLLALCAAAGLQAAEQPTAHRHAGQVAARGNGAGEMAGRTMRARGKAEGGRRKTESRMSRILG